MSRKYLLLIFFIITALSACQTEKNFEYKLQGFTQGTSYSVIWYDTRGADDREVGNDIYDLLTAVDSSLSTYNMGSVISLVNRNEEVVLDTLFLKVFNKSYEIWLLTEGAFDITAAPLINAWGFGPDATKRFNESIKDRLMELVGMDKIKIVDGMVIKSDPDMCLDVNAIAQGYTVDLIYGYLSARGLESYLVEVGGEVRTRGTKPDGRPWIIGLDKPSDGNISPGLYRQADIKLVDKALATSGNYRKYYIEDGIKYSHTIDPKTGYPVRHQLLSATIITDDCMTADALATACMVMGLEKAKEFIHKIEGLEAYLVYSGKDGDFNTWFTDGMINYLSD
ncbi:MAG: FAD:protein FMN transferase [Bacteroidales bacterium]|nr:FAD:protein FMN transferase [Bacteroidales bacterium]